MIYFSPIQSLQKAASAGGVFFVDDRLTQEMHSLCLLRLGGNTQ